MTSVRDSAGNTQFTKQHSLQKYGMRQESNMHAFLGKIRHVFSACTLNNKGA